MLKNHQDAKYYVVYIFHSFKKFNEKQKWNPVCLI